MRRVALRNSSCRMDGGEFGPSIGIGSCAMVIPVEPSRTDSHGRAGVLIVISSRLIFRTVPRSKFNSAGLSLKVLFRHRIDIVAEHPSPTACYFIICRNRSDKPVRCQLVRRCRTIQLVATR